MIREIRGGLWRKGMTYAELDQLALGHARELLRLAPRMMGVRMASVFSTTFIGPLPANANETLVFTTGPLGLAVDNAAVLLFWTCSITAGTSTTGLAYRLRRGNLVTSPLVNVSSFLNTTAAGNTQVTSGVYADQPGVAAGVQYSLTVAQAADTVAGVFVDGCLMAIVL